MGTVSKNFDYSEFEVTTYPELVEKNKIKDADVLANVKSLVDTCLQPLRDALGVPVIVNSGYRCKEVNERAGGVANSQHLCKDKSAAADIRTNSHTPFDIACAAADIDIPYDQMILYNNFVHISHVRDGRQRGQILYDKDYEGQRL